MSYNGNVNYINNENHRCSSKELYSFLLSICCDFCYYSHQSQEVNWKAFLTMSNHVSWRNLQNILGISFVGCQDIFQSLNRIRQYRNSQMFQKFTFFCGVSKKLETFWFLTMEFACMLERQMLNEEYDLLDLF